MKYAYPIICSVENGYFLAKAPDLSGVVVGGESLEELLQEAANGCAMWLDDALVKNETLPTPSDPTVLKPELGEFITHAFIDLAEFRRKYRSRSVRKTLSLPEWMAKDAEQRGFSLSQILQEALQERLAMR